MFVCQLTMMMSGCSMPLGFFMLSLRVMVSRLIVMM
jgi:hypothetical protein